MARSDRTHGAEGVIPAPLWIVLFSRAAVIFVFMLFFADPAEAWFVQATMMGGVAVVIVVDAAPALRSSTSRTTRASGGLRPVAMERTLRLLDGVGIESSGRFRVPCDASGVAAA